MAVADSKNAAAPAGGGVGRLVRLARKELRESLRDRRTILTLVLMPLLLYPLLSIAFRLFFLSHLGTTRAPEYRIGLLSEEDGKLLLKYLMLANEADEAPDQAAALATEPSEAKPQPKLDFRFAETPEQLENAVRNGEIHVGIRLSPNSRREIRFDRSLALDGELLYAEGSLLGKEALEYLESRFAAANARFLDVRLHLLRVRQRPVPVQLTRVFLPDTEHKNTISLTAVVPLILILMTITGAVYPAIDLTAGERERGTLEILVAAPIPRLGLLFAKYVTVVTVALLTALVNLGMMLVTMYLSGVGPLLFGESGLPVLLVLQVFGLLLLFAAFFSAVLLTLTSFARSFKEAQAYLIPLMLLSLVPGVLGVMPGLPLSGTLAVVPLLNIVLLARDLFVGRADPGMAALVLLSTFLYALAALAVAAQLFGAEGVLYNEHRGWFDFLRRRPKQGQGKS
jgi:sodium transport system permease protein